MLSSPLSRRAIPSSLNFGIETLPSRHFPPYYSSSASSLSPCSSASPAPATSRSSSSITSGGSSVADMSRPDVPFERFPIQHRQQSSHEKLPSVRQLLTPQSQDAEMGATSGSSKLPFAPPYSDRGSSMISSTESRSAHSSPFQSPFLDGKTSGAAASTTAVGPSISMHRSSSAAAATASSASAAAFSGPTSAYFPPISTHVPPYLSSQEPHSPRDHNPSDGFPSHPGSGQSNHPSISRSPYLQPSTQHLTTPAQSSDWRGASQSVPPQLPLPPLQAYPPLSSPLITTNGGPSSFASPTSAPGLSSSRLHDHSGAPQALPHEYATFSTSLPPLSHSASNAMTQASPSSALPPKPMPKLIGERFIAGEGVCYLYDDNSHVRKVIDGEAVNAQWGVTKAGKPRKRLAIACLTCREKKIKCDPAPAGEGRCVQCEKGARECRFTTA